MTSCVCASVNAIFIATVKRYRDASCSLLIPTGTTEMASTSPVRSASAPASSGLTVYLPRPMNSARIFSVRMSSTWKNVLRFSSFGMPTTLIVVGRNDPRPASA